MKAAVPIILSVILMHLVGCAVFFGAAIGIYGVLGAPLLGLIAWFMIPFEVVGVLLQWILYSPKKESRWTFLLSGVLSAAVGGLLVMIFMPKFLGFLTGASAAEVSFLCIHFFKAHVFDQATEPYDASDKDDSPRSPNPDETAAEPSGQERRE